ncbi:hypothetical protein T11_1335 [Trichinella zimbabwensis]|uniref:Uncharacterized protein n=1 Tax=Trichinella zimbabwensis TaxID=268475 RepID=A0A0V1H6K7_9BILA|nr:hypothetical protein T11_1335 [Trichinella zimbabwensis]
MPIEEHHSNRILLNNDEQINVDSVGIDRDWNENTNHRLATTIDCLPWTAAAAAGQIVSACSAQIQKEQMFRRSMSPAVAFLHHLLCIGWSIG